MSGHLELVTAWYRQLAKGQPWYFNHVESGHVMNATPMGTTLQNRLWASSRWRSVHAYRNPIGKITDARGQVIQL